MVMQILYFISHSPNDSNLKYASLLAWVTINTGPGTRRPGTQGPEDQGPNDPALLHLAFMTEMQLVSMF